MRRPWISWPPSTRGDPSIKIVNIGARMVSAEFCDSEDGRELSQQAFSIKKIKKFFCYRPPEVNQT